MILCIDIGNTNIVLGIYDDNKLINTYRLRTDTNQTVDEYGIKFKDLFNINNIDINQINGMIYSSVVPKLDSVMNELARKYFNIEAISIGPGIKTGINIKIDNPKELGADILVGAVSASNKYGPNVLVIDMGTAITFGYVNKNYEYLGGSILPGIHTSFSGLFSNTSKLEVVGFGDTKGILGKDTKTCIQSGMIYGFTSMMEGMIDKYKELLGDFKVVMTGGESKVISKYMNKKYNVIFDENLLLDGLMMIYEKNIKL